MRYGQTDQPPHPRALMARHIRSFVYHTPTRESVFTPIEAPKRGRKRNPPHELWHADSTLSARLIVGFNVGHNPYWRLEDLVTLVRDERIRDGHPSASFVPQRGVYQHEAVDGHGEIVTEDGAQVTIICDYTSDVDAFTEEMIDLGGYIAKMMRQESVIVEIQHNGTTLGTYGVGWEPSTAPRF